MSTGCPISVTNLINAALINPPSLNKVKTDPEKNIFHLGQFGLVWKELRRSISNWSGCSSNSNIALKILLFPCFGTPYSALPPHYLYWIGWADTLYVYVCIKVIFIIYHIISSQCKQCLLQLTLIWSKYINALLIYITLQYMLWYLISDFCQWKMWKGLLPFWSCMIGILCLKYVTCFFSGDTWLDNCFSFTHSVELYCYWFFYNRTMWYFSIQARKAWSWHIKECKRMPLTQTL